MSPNAKAVCAALCLLTLTAAQAGPSAGQPLMIDWDKLLPEKERAHFTTQAPPPIHDYLGEGGKAVRQSGSAAVNRRLAEVYVKIPGYVVPIVISAKGVISEFFLVPYLGSCIHVPPPPPNQLVYVKLAGGGILLDTLEEPFWVTGTLHTRTEETRLAKSSYTLDASRMELYKY